MTSPLTRHLRMIADGIEDQHKASDVRHAADLLDQQRVLAKSSRVTDEMVHEACEVYGQVYVDDDKDMGDAMRAALESALAAHPSAVPAQGEQPTVPVDAIVNLVNHQEQCDMDGVMVKVSRQALAEVLVYVTEVRPDNKWAHSPAEGERISETEIILDAINDRSPRARQVIDLVLYKFDVRRRA